MDSNKHKIICKVVNNWLNVLKDSINRKKYIKIPLYDLWKIHNLLNNIYIFINSNRLTRIINPFH